MSGRGATETPAPPDRTPTETGSPGVYVGVPEKVVTFEWQARRFAVRTSLETFELKGDRLFITGASGLVLYLLMSRARNREVFGEMAKNIEEAETRVRDNPEQALELLSSVKKTIEKRIPAKSNHEKAN